MKNWKPTKCPQIRGWLRKCRHVHVTEQYAAMTILWSFLLSVALRPPCRIQPHRRMVSTRSMNPERLCCLYGLYWGSAPWQGDLPHRARDPTDNFLVSSGRPEALQYHVRVSLSLASSHAAPGLTVFFSSRVPWGTSKAFPFHHEEQSSCFLAPTSQCILGLPRPGACRSAEPLLHTRLLSPGFCHWSMS